QGVIALCGVGLAAAFAIAAMFEAPNPTMSNPPVYIEAVLGIGAIASAFILPLVELGRVIHGWRRAPYL
ncbi:MAG: hypothetical protein ABIZ80_01740, partial [Bryobacteraceae bacterium]